MFPVAGGSALNRLSWSSVSWTATAPTFSSIRAMRRVSGMGAMFSLCARSQASSTCAGVAPISAANAATWSARCRWCWKFSPVKRGLSARKSEGANWSVERIVPVRKPRPRGEKGHEADVQLPQHRGCARVDVVLVVQVDVVGAQPLERALGSGADAGRAGVRAALAAGVGDQAELGRRHDLVPVALEGSAHELLVGVGAVDLGGVDEGHAQCQGAVDRADRLVVVASGAAVAVGHAHRAQVDPETSGAGVPREAHTLPGAGPSYRTVRSGSEATHRPPNRVESTLLNIAALC